MRVVLTNIHERLTIFTLSVASYIFSVLLGLRYLTTIQRMRCIFPYITYLARRTFD